MAITSLDILNLSHSLKDICEVNCNTPECLSQTLKLLMQYRKEAGERNVPVTELVQGIISDIEMPNLDGLTLCRVIKEDPVLREIPVAIFSSLISESLARKCENVGADAQFAKPDLQAISDRMYELIRNAGI